jgi:C-terminal processing protease CtpA/Prc
MYNTIKNNKASGRILALFIGTSMFSYRKRNFFDFGHNPNQFMENLNNKQDFKNKEVEIQTNEDQEKLENEIIPRFKLFKFDHSSIINMIYFPIQYSLFFFNETLSKKYASCNNEDIKKPYLGCSIRFNDEFKGMRIINVKSDSPAEKAGIKVNDVIVEIAGLRILSINDYNIAIGFEAGEKIFRILRVDDQGERTVESIKIDLSYQI